MLGIYKNKIWRTSGEVKDGHIELRKYRGSRLVSVIFAKPENVILDDSPQWFEQAKMIPMANGRKSSQLFDLMVSFS